VVDPDSSADVIVVGAGIVGICCALSIAERGKRVRLVDRDEPGQGCSYGNAGIISPWSLVPQSVPGLWKTIPGMVLKEDGPVSIRVPYLPKLIPWGLRFLRKGTEAQVRAAADAMETLNQSNVQLYRRHLEGTGYEHLVRDSWYVHAFRNAKAASDALRELEPALSHDFAAAILIKGQARAVSPGEIARVLCDKAQRLGVEVTRATVRALNRAASERWVVHSDAGDFTAQKLVVAAGARWRARCPGAFGWPVRPNLPTATRPPTTNASRNWRAWRVACSPRSTRRG